MLMMIMLISHTLSDFIIKSSNIVLDKTKIKMSAYLSHGKWLIITSIPILIFLKVDSWIDIIIRIMGIIVIHLGLEFCKEKLQQKLVNHEKFNIINAFLFICNQIMNISIIALITSNVELEYNVFSRFLLDALLVRDGLTYADLKILFVVLYVAFSGAYFIPLIFDIVYGKVSNYGEKLNYILKVGVEEDEHSFIDEVKTGKWIGILERILILIFLFTNQLASIGIIIAVKSLARFKMMDNKIFSEYYLIGTLLSVVYTFVLYEFFQRML